MSTAGIDEKSLAAHDWNLRIMNLMLHKLTVRFRIERPVGRVDLLNGVASGDE
jgi:hypothetical protein